ncbi:MAG TPA: AMP-binding protein [Candidatus Acidoferrum sp.]|nr:AMP-binding protein [Candidatus Acidoferrum sp.]
MRTNDDRARRWRHTRPAAHESWDAFADRLPTIGEHWIDTCKSRGNPVVIIDTLGTVLRAKQALAATVMFARRIGKLSPEPNIGLLLPSSSGSLLANLAVALLGKTAVNLNFTASGDALLSSLQQAQVRTIYTSQRFLDRLQTRGVDLAPVRQHARLVLLEELRAGIPLAEKVLTLLACRLLPASLLKRWLVRSRDNRDVAVILFSSGSEGQPKGVTLTHRNLVINVKQISQLLAFRDDDVVLANLPPFHALGLTVTHYMPALERVKVVCHADPLDVVGAAEAIASHNITTMFGTCSFYRLYNRNAKIRPEQLRSVRLCIAGAEKLQEDVRLEFARKFSKGILEGYGATETAPVASVNLPERVGPDGSHLPAAWKPGSVGPPLPGTAFRIVDPTSFAALPTGEAGMVLINGAQVMPGYLDNHDKTQAALRLIDGQRWYVTGDKGYLDADGFLFLIDRYSRFAKIGGEMVGFGTVEAAIRSIVNDDNCEVVVTSVPDERKGERLVAFVTQALDANAMREKLLATGLNALALPSYWFQLEAIPKLGSGKTDFAAVARLAQTKVGAG